MKPILFFTALAMLLLQSLIYAQQSNLSVSGNAKDENAPVAYAYISFKNNATTLEQTTLTDEEGNFTFGELTEGIYTLSISATGYENYADDSVRIQYASLNSSKTLLLPDVVLKKQTNQVEGVTITALKPFIEVKADKIVANISNSVLAAGNSVFDLLGKMPGVHIDNNDNIVLKGKPGVQIWMDGKPTLMAGSDLANVLRGMSSQQIDKIEIIANPGAKYDAEGVGGIINIITKKDKRKGVNGSLNISYGQGVYPKYGIGGNLNFRKNKLTVNLNYQYNMKYWFNHLILDRNFLDANDNSQFKYLQDNYAKFNFKNNIASASIDYAVTPKTTVGIALSGVTNAFEPESDNSTQALDGNGTLLYTSNTAATNKNLYYNASANASLRHNFDSTGKQLSIDLDYAAFGNNGDQNFVTTYANPDGSPYLDNYYQKSNLDGITDIKSLKADYTHPVNDSFRIEAGVKSSFVKADNNPLFYQKNGGDYTLDSSRSNHFIYKENINAAYVNVNKEYKKIGVQLGLRMENTNASGVQYTNQTAFDTSYIQLFPNLAFQYHLNDKNDLGITLSRRIERPNYQQLNPFKYFIDKTTYREGYPYLTPASYYSAELTHTYKQRFVTTLSYGINRGYIIEVIQPSETEDSVTVQTVKNAKQLTFIGLSTSYPFQFTKWWSAYTSANIYYVGYKADIANTPLNKGSLGADMNINNTFILPQNFVAELSFAYQSPQVYGYMDLKANWMLNAGVQKSFYNKKLNVKLNIQDIFFTGYPRATSIYTGYKESFISKRETRVATLSLTYNFGSTQNNMYRRRSGGAEEEKSRASSNGAS